MNKKILFSIIILSLCIMPITFAAEESIEFNVFGFELEKLLNFGSGVLATVLFILVIKAYKRHKKNRLKFVALAFFLFAINGFLTSIDLIGLDIAWVDPVSSIIHFGIMLSFFYGIIKK